MKNPIYLLMLLTIIVSSCYEENLLHEPNPYSLSTLEFEDTDQMLYYFDSKNNEGVNSSQRQSFQPDSEFKSFKEVFYTAVKELNEIETDEEHELLLQNYSDVITLIDSVYVPKIKNPFYQEVCNRDGIYQSEGYAHKIIDHHYMVVTESRNISLLQDVQSTSGLDSEIFRIVPYNASNQLEQGRSMANCGSDVVKTYFNNNKRCRDDRKVYVTGSASFIVSGYYFTPKVFVQAYGTYRNGWCNWNLYETTVRTRDCSFTVTATMNQNTYTDSRVLPDEESDGDVFSIEMYNATTRGAIYWQGGAYPTIQFTQINLEATTRGVNGAWVELNCQ